MMTTQRVIPTYMMWNSQDGTVKEYSANHEGVMITRRILQWQFLTVTNTLPHATENVDYERPPAGGNY